MSPRPTLDQLFAALEQHPAEPSSVLALAEHHARNGQTAAAAALHWAVLNEKRPFRYTRDAELSVDFEEWGEGWFWWATEAADDDEADYGQDWGHPKEGRLPLPLWRAMPHTFEYEPAVFKEYETLREAYQALIDGWIERLAELTDPNRHPTRE